MTSQPTSNVHPFVRRHPGAEASPQQPPEGTRRTALWDLPSGCLCPVVGTCLGVHELRSLLDGLFGGTSEASDFELHAVTVRECGARNKISELLQRELDQRHADDIDRLAPLRQATALADAWEAAEASGEIVGPLWAVMTHPCCDDALRERMLGDVHMAQHHGLASSRRLMASTAQLGGENARLRAENAALRARLEPLLSQQRSGHHARGLTAHAMQSLERALRGVGRLAGLGGRP